MSYRFVVLGWWVLGIAIILGFVGACSTEHYKADADKEVYEIIVGKWKDDFGSKSNYIVNDSNIPASPNDIVVEAVIPTSGVLSLAQAVAIATAQNRDYQRINLPSPAPSLIVNVR